MTDIGILSMIILQCVPFVDNFSKLIYNLINTKSIKIAFFKTDSEMKVS